MINFFHKLLNPHCADCIAEKACNSCIELHDQLQHERNMNKELIKALVELTKPEQVIVPSSNEVIKSVSKHIPWHIQRATLEAEDRRNAEEINRKKNEEINVGKSVNELEEELGITNASKIS